MQVFQAAGYRVPDDLAVVGFDDVLEAQYASPPLTTVRSQFDVIGRAAAEQLLAEMRDGRAAHPQIISVPTTMLHRRSCGCTTLDDLLPGDGAARNDLPAGRRHLPSSWFRWCATRCRSIPHSTRPDLAGGRRAGRGARRSAQSAASRSRLGSNSPGSRLSRRPRTWKCCTPQ